MEGVAFWRCMRYNEKAIVQNEEGDLVEAIYFLGQAGLLFQLKGKNVIVDPYFTDTVRQFEPQNYRRQPVDVHFAEIQPDILLLTHDHLDHYDKPTVARYLQKGGVTVLAPYSVWQDVRTCGGNNEYVLFDEGTSVTAYGIRIRAVKAAHSDPYAIGAVLYDDKDAYYITGDTLYSEKVFASLPSDGLRAVFLPINGKGNNMNACDAAAFAERTGADCAVPLHFGMFDEMSGREFQCAIRTVIPEIYKEIQVL